MTLWESRAKKYGASHEASWADAYGIDLEIGAIAKHLLPGDKVLDVGCANGYSAKQQQRRKNISIQGIDACPAMVSLCPPLEATVADARELPFESKSFDVVYTTRVLINLESWEDQQKVIRECIRVAKRKVLFSESFWEPLQKLNALRLAGGLKPLVEPDFNRYLSMERLKDFLGDASVEDFSGLYYIGSRFLREIVSDQKGYTNPFNKVFLDLQKRSRGGGFGVQQLVAVEP